MITLPLTFLSAAFMPLELAPEWIRTVATFNPVNWAVEAGRVAIATQPDWGFVLVRMGGLAVVALGCVALATAAFRAYQRAA
jgi:ABC-2 type transport system permease protein